MITSLLLLAVVALLVLPFFLFCLYKFFRFFLARARKKKALEGAAFWLTSLFLCLIFAIFGVIWGLFKLFL